MRLVNSKAASRFILMVVILMFILVTISFYIVDLVTELSYLVIFIYLKNKK